MQKIDFCIVFYLISINFTNSYTGGEAILNLFISFFVLLQNVLHIEIFKFIVFGFSVKSLILHDLQF